MELKRERPRQVGKPRRKSVCIYRASEESLGWGGGPRRPALEEEEEDAHGPVMGTGSQCDGAQPYKRLKT